MDTATASWTPPWLVDPSGPESVVDGIKLVEDHLLREAVADNADRWVNADAFEEHICLGAHRAKEESIVPGASEHRTVSLTEEGKTT